MRFWDSSALLPLHVKQAATARVRKLYAQDHEVVAWVLSDIEMRSAIERLAREGAMGAAQGREAVRRTEEFWSTVHVFSLVDAAKLRAKRLLALHPLRAADAMQLGAALAVAGDDPSTLEFVCLDDRLREAAAKEGFRPTP